MTKQELFLKAHQIAKLTRYSAGSYKIAFICALRDLYKHIHNNEKIVSCLGEAIIFEKNGKLFTENNDYIIGRVNSIDGNVEIRKVRGFWGYWTRKLMGDGRKHNKFIKLGYDLVRGL